MDEHGGLDAKVEGGTDMLVASFVAAAAAAAQD